jgi:hypothetical protein
MEKTPGELLFEEERRNYLPSLLAKRLPQATIPAEFFADPPFPFEKLPPEWKEAYELRAAGVPVIVHPLPPSLRALAARDA